MLEGLAPRTSRPRERALAGLAALLTEAPWLLDRADLARAQEAGLTREELEQAFGVCAFFNYFPRMADGTGVAFDYESALPRIVVDRDVEPLPRPPREEWSSRCDGSQIPTFEHRPHAREPWLAWRRYVLERDGLLTARERRVIARAVAEHLCDGGPARAWPDAVPASHREAALARYAAVVTLTPWNADATALAPLRELGMEDPTLLDALSVAAHQNALSRLQHALSVLELSVG